jgi:molybdate/tungstate transport system ATP-binding protein
MIEVIDLRIEQGTFRLHDVSFAIPQGKYGVLMGPTGCGKTSILEAICGLRHPAAGRIILAGRDVTRLKPAGRNLGYVPQDGALFQTMTVRRHLEFALRIRGWPRHQREARVAQLASMLGIEHLLHRRPAGLSGGEAQRVALGRALSFQPAILCLDEPLSALDDDTRAAMIDLLKRVQRETGVTALHVTHNRHEAEQLADYRLQLLDGSVVERQTFLA